MELGQLKNRRKENRRMSELAAGRMNYLHAYVQTQADTAHAARHIRMMERLSLRMDITIPARIKRSYCKECKMPYGTKARIRLKNRLVTVTCGNCGNVRRIPY